MAIPNYCGKTLRFGADNNSAVPLREEPAAIHVMVLQEAEEYTEDETVLLTINTTLPEEARIKKKTIVMRYEGARRDTQLGKCSIDAHQIDTGNAEPIAKRPRKLSPEKQKEVQRQVQDLLRAGAIVETRSPWAAPIVVVPKKGGRVAHVC